MRVALVTAREVVDVDADGEAVVWDDGGVDWASYDVAVVRSTRDLFLDHVPAPADVVADAVLRRVR